MGTTPARDFDTTLRNVFGEDYCVVQTLSILPEYQVELDTFSYTGENKFRIIRFEKDASTPKSVWKKVVLAEFDDKKEFVAMAKLIVASVTTH